MNIPPFFLVLLAAALCGCAAGGGPHQPGLPPPEPVDLSLGILPIRPEEGFNEEAAEKMRMANIFASVEAVRSFQAQDVDVFVSITNNMGKFTLSPSAMFPDVTATSAYTRKRLYSGKSRCKGFDKYCVNGDFIAADLARALGPGTPAYSELAAKRSARLARKTPAPVAADPAPPKQFTSDMDHPKFKLAERPDDFALVVGIDDYKDLPAAQFAERDAAAMARHLSAMGYPQRHVVLLTGENATRTGLRKYLEEWLPLNVKPNSNVFFYFSGHGAPDPATGKAYLVPWDGDAQFLKTTAYSVEHLYASLNGLKAKQIVVALDACFSGAGGRSVLAAGARPLVTQIDMGQAPSGKLTLLTAASGNEITTTLKEEGHGIFTYFLLKGLNGEAKDSRGSVTTKSLYDYLKPKVQDEARLQNREQTPTYHSASDVVLRGR
ncbi:MAG: caspase family protein [Elusimicrobiota bacterium]